MVKKNLEFPLKGDLTYEVIEKAQERLLKIAITVRDILEANNIEYTILFGTLLGAVRHKGFIPWDLDFDMGVPEEIYENALEIISHNLPAWLTVLNSEIDEKYCASWSKIVDKNSIIHFTQYDGDNDFMYKGLHIDIYKLKRTNEKQYLRDLAIENKRYFDLKYERGLLSQEKYLELTKPLEEKLILKDNEIERDEYFFLHLFKAKANKVFPSECYLFEDEIFKGPCDFEAVLKGCYYSGDYMLPPAYEDRDTKMDSIKFLQ